MDYQFAFGLLLGGIWGSVVAGFIRKSEMGRLLAYHLMWLVVSIGIGVDMLIALALFTQAGLTRWSYLISLFAVSAIPLAVGSLYGHLLPTFRQLMNRAD